MFATGVSKGVEQISVCLELVQKTFRDVKQYNGSLSFFFFFLKAVCVNSFSDQIKGLHVRLDVKVVKVCGRLHE